MDYIAKFGEHGLPVSSALFVGALALTVYYNKLVKGLGFTEMFKGGGSLAQIYAIMTCVLIGLVVLSAIAYAVKKDEIKSSKNPGTGKVTRIPEATYDIGALALTVGVVGSLTCAILASLDKSQDFSNIFTQDNIMKRFLTLAIAAIAVLIVSEVLGRTMNDKELTVTGENDQDKTIDVDNSPASVLHEQITNCFGQGNKAV